MPYDRTAPFGRCFRLIWFGMNISFVLIQTTCVRVILVTKSTLIPMIHNEFRMLQPHMFVLGAKGLCIVIKIECTECFIADGTFFNLFNSFQKFSEFSEKDAREERLSGNNEF